MVLEHNINQYYDYVHEESKKMFAQLRARGEELKKELSEESTGIPDISALMTA